jgi:hypothetical protein
LPPDRRYVESGRDVPQPNLTFGIRCLSIT